MKRILVAILMLSSSLLFAAPTAETTDESALVPFIDDLGRTVMLPSTIETICPTGSMAQVILLTFTPEKLAGLSTSMDEGEEDYYTNLPEDLPILGTFYGKRSNLNREALIVASPDVVVDIGEIKGSLEEMAKDLDVLQAQIGMPVVFIESHLADTAHTYRRLGELLGEEERGDELALWAEEAIAFAGQMKAEHGGTVSFYYSSVVDGLEAIPASNFHGEVLEAVGAENVCPSTFSGGGNAMSLEQIFLWDPDVIILSSEDAYRTATAPGSDWSSLSAVQNGRVYLVPQIIKNWIDTPPSVNRLIGIYWAAATFYGDVCDVREMAKDYCSLFYGYSPTEANFSKYGL